MSPRSATRYWGGDGLRRGPTDLAAWLGAWIFSVLVLTAASPAAADTGYFAGTEGARPAGRAGAFVAKADDVSALMVNPAGLAALDGTRVQVGNRFSYNFYAYHRAGTLDWGRATDGIAPRATFSTSYNQEPWQLLDPLVGITTDFGLEDWGFGISIQAPAGTAKERFPVDGGQRYMMVSRTAEILNYTVGAAYKYKDRFGIGASLVWIDVPKLRYQLVIDGSKFPRDANPVSSELDMLATVSGSDRFTPNAVLGTWYRPTPYLQIGLSGQIVPTSIETHSRLAVDPTSPEIDENVQLYRNGTPADDVRLTLPLPVTVRTGIRYLHHRRKRELFDVELDAVYESWSRVDRFRLRSNQLIATLLGERLDIDRIDVNKHWNDTVTLQLGSDVVVIDQRLIARGGLFYQTALADPAYANVDFVSGRQLGGALGASVFIERLELAVAYEFRYQPPVRIAERDARVFQQTPGSLCEPPYTDVNTCNEHYLGQPAPAANAGTYRAHSHVLEVDLLYRL